MKIIISHDVDHMYSIDHWKHDLIIEKLWVRSLIHLFQGKINLKIFINRLFHPFHRRYCRIEEVIAKDLHYQIPSVFFFGMSRGLGMSYGKEKAKKYIRYVREKGFDVGVHGIDFQNEKNIKEEYKDFQEIVSDMLFGIRMHYVRYDELTFEKLSKTGYLFDSSRFDKQGKEYLNPYKVGNMWEFPIHIMDGYIIPEGNLELAKKQTLDAIRRAEKSGIEYCTILFHDYLYNEKIYPVEKMWYDWLLQNLSEQRYQFISYRDALKELENKNARIS